MPRSFRQFGLRTLLLFCTLAAVCFGLGRWHMTWVDHQHDLAQQIADKKGDVRWGTWGPAWIHDTFGSYYFSNIIAVDWHHRGIRDDDLERLRDISTLEELYVPGNRKITDQGMKVLESFPRLRKLAMWNTTLTDETLKSVGTLKNLEILDLHQSKTTEAGLTHLRGLPKLRRLGHNWIFTEVGIQSLATLPSLEIYTIHAKDLPDRSFRQIKEHLRVRNLIVRRPQGDQWGTHLLNHPTLEILEVYQGEMSSQQLRKILLSNRLRSLKLEDVPAGDAALFPRPERMRTTRLTLFRTKITPKALFENFGADARFVAITADVFQPLVNIRLSGAPFGPDCYWTGPFDPADLRYVAHCRDAKNISISGVRLPNPRLDFGGDQEARRKFEQCCKVTDADLRLIADLPKLESLKIVGSQQISPDGLEVLRGVENLRFLILTSAKLTDQHLTVIGQLKTLQQLIISSNPITNDGIGELEMLTELIYLNISDCDQIDDEAFEALEKLKNLRALDISGTQIGGEEKQLKEKNPNLQIMNYRASSPFGRLPDIALSLPVVVDSVD